MHMKQVYFFARYNARAFVLVWTKLKFQFYLSKNLSELKKQVRTKLKFQCYISKSEPNKYELKSEQTRWRATSWLGRRWAAGRRRRQQDSTTLAIRIGSDGGETRLPLRLAAGTCSPPPSSSPRAYQIHGALAAVLDVLHLAPSTPPPSSSTRPRRRPLV